MSNAITEYGNMRYQEDYQISSQAQLSTLLQGFNRKEYKLTGWIDQDGKTYSPQETIQSEKNLYLSAMWKEQYSLKIISKTGNVYKYEAEELNTPYVLKYRDSHGSVWPPFDNNAELSNRSNIYGVIDNGDILSIQQYCFYWDRSWSGTDGLTYVKCPKVTDIGAYAFRMCSSLTSIDCPEVTSIGDGAFGWCSNLSSINFPKVTIIPMHTFNTCANLSFINLPSVLSIEQYAFSSCDNLTSINCPKVLNIGTMVFKNCPKLSSVIISGMTEDNLTQITDISFGDKGERSYPVSVYVPAGVYKTLKSQQGWTKSIDNNIIQLIGMK